MIKHISKNRIIIKFVYTYCKHMMTTGEICFSKKTLFLKVSERETSLTGQLSFIYRIENLFF